jgi:hypothetical protein
MMRPKKSDRFPIPRVEVSQSCNQIEPPELGFIHRFYGGSLYSASRASKRKSWTLSIHTKAESPKILSVIADYGIVKRAQAVEALRYIKDGRSDPDMTYDLILSCNNNYQNIVIDANRLTFPYIAGLFAAEGCVGMYAKTSGPRPKIQAISVISQKGCVRLLHAIRTKLGFGSVNTREIRFSSGQTKKFLEQIKPYLRASQKVSQVNLVWKHVSSSAYEQRKKRTTEQREEIESMVKELKRLKKT